MINTTTATYIIPFDRRPRSRHTAEENHAVGRVPRVTRLLALAHRLEGMIGSGEIRDWAEAARLAGLRSPTYCCWLRRFKKAS